MKSVLMVGMGSIGKKHARLIREHFDIEVLSRHDDTRGKEIMAVFICTPTYSHIGYAINFADYPVFLEKPISNTERLLDSFCGWIKKPVYVAYPLRHNPDIQNLKQAFNPDCVYKTTIEARTNLLNWPGRDNPDSYSRNWHKGGGAILELSHEIDLAEHLFGEVKSITGSATNTGRIDIAVEDLAYLKLVHISGSETQIVLDIASEYDVRRIETAWQDPTLGATMSYSKDYSATEETYINQLEYFFDNLDNPNLMNNIHDASKLFKKIIEFRESENVTWQNH